MKHIVIIGNGISGITAARHIRKNSNHQITVISAETDHFYSRTALMYIYMGHMTYNHTKPYEDGFWKKNRIDLTNAFVKQIDFETKTLELDSGKHIIYDDLVLATGSKSNKFGWPGQDLKGVQGMYNYQDLESMETDTKGINHAVVIGGGLIGVEMVEMLQSRNISVTFLVREGSFWDIVLPKQESELINRHIKEHHVDLRLSTELKEIISDENGRVKSIITNNGDEIDCQFVGLTVGVSPNVDFLKKSALAINRGIHINEYLETNMSDVYAIGDCAERTTPVEGRRPIEQVWYTGRMMGEAVAQTICGNKTAYSPGHWFNSAKFFDIEYQTYGTVSAQRQPNEAEFYWEDTTGKKCVHMIFDKNTSQFIGINNFGIRLRHEVFDQWLDDQVSIKHVMENLDSANFDPEFFKRYEQEISSQFNREFPDYQVSIKPTKGFFSKIFS
jgi:NAD(P)H-nitrite reductase large subunit